MSIPFIRGYADGRRAVQEIKRDDGIETLAHSFLGRKGRYLVEELESGQVHLFALIDVPDEETGALEPRNVCAVICDNSAEVFDGVDWLVKESIKYIPDIPKPKIKIPSAGQVRRLTKAELRNNIFLVK